MYKVISTLIGVSHDNTAIQSKSHFDMMMGEINNTLVNNTNADIQSKQDINLCHEKGQDNEQ